MDERPENTEWLQDMTRLPINTLHLGRALRPRAFAIAFVFVPVLVAVKEDVIAFEVVIAHEMENGVVSAEAPVVQDFALARYPRMAGARQNDLRYL